MVADFVNSSDFRPLSSYASWARQACNHGDGWAGFEWVGRVTIPTTGTAASGDVVTYSEQKNIAPVTGLTLPANTVISRLAIMPMGAITLGAATGRVKLAATLTANTSGLFVNSAAAVSNVIAVSTDWSQQVNNPPVTVGASAITLRLFATDGAAAGSEVASTFTATTATDVLVYVSGRIRSPLPNPKQILTSPGTV